MSAVAKWLELRTTDKEHGFECCAVVSNLGQVRSLSNSPVHADV